MGDLPTTPYLIDATTFQKPLVQLAEVLAQKVNREAQLLLRAPEFVTGTIFVQMRQMMRTYDLLFYLNADERREKDCYWKPAYSVSALPLVRTMIDHLYNITAILVDPAVKGPEFCKSGFRRLLEGVDADEKRYGGQGVWDEYIDKRKRVLELLIRKYGFTLDQVRNQRPWPTLGAYLWSDGAESDTPHKTFLKIFTYGMWREYSAQSHGAFEGSYDTGIYFVEDSLPHEERPKLDDEFPRIISLHLTRAAALLLCVVTELQARFHFEGARINERIQQMWKVLMPVFGVKELYTEHYAELMKNSGIVS